MNSEDQIAVTLIDNDLPEGWALPRISDLIEINYGKGLKESDRKVGPVPVYGSNGVVGNHNASLSKGSAIIVGRKGSVGFVHFSLMPCWPIDTTYYIDKFNGLNPQFLMYALRTLDLADLDTSTAIPGLNRNDVYMQKIPLPPLNEQKRIVAKVEELLTRVNATKERLAKVSLILKRFRQAVLAAACSGRLTAAWREENQTEDLPEGSELPPGWRWMPIKELLPPGGIFDGPFGSNLKTADYTDNGIRVVRLENVGSLQFIHSKETYISQEKYKILSKHTVGVGDIIFASFIDEEVRACVLPELPTKAIAKADCFCLRPRQDVVDRHYLKLQLVSRESYERLSESVHGATRPRINTTQLRNLEVRICSLPEQHEIVRRVEALFGLADAVEKRVAAATARAEKLSQSILAKAFRGELVPTEAELARRERRSYEPASDLLARIKSDRESKQASQKVRRNRNL
jgi:type I restriction enzyme S subunit